MDKNMEHLKSAMWVLYIIVVAMDNLCTVAYIRSASWLLYVTHFAKTCQNALNNFLHYGPFSSA